MAPILRVFITSTLASTLMASMPALAYGERDPDYASATTPGWSCSGSLAPLPDDSVVFSVASNEVPRHYGIVKMRPDGTRDPLWMNGQVAPIADAAQFTMDVPPLPLPEGGVIILGYQLQRLHKDGSIDTSYGTNGLSDFVGEVVSAALQADGSVVVLTLHGRGFGLIPVYEFRRVLADGRMDSSFGRGGMLDTVSDYGNAFSPAIYAWTVKDDGTVEMGYSLTNGNGDFVPELHRFPVDFTDADRPRGRVMPRAGVASWVGPTVLVDGAGGAVFAISISDGTFGQSGSYGRVMLARFLSDGSVDAGFGLTPIVLASQGSSSSGVQDIRLSRSADGKWDVFVALVERRANFPTFIDLPTNDAIRFGADGRPDPTFRQSQLLPSIRVARLNSGKLITNGESTQVGACQLERLLTDGEPRVDGIMVEYFHPVLRHYFMTLDTFEAAGIDAVPYGWERTGRTFAAWQPVEAPATTPVCRFYGDPVIGPNSHFYTPEGYECDGLIALEQSTPPGVPVWHLEGKPFRASLPSADGTCPGNLDPVFRVFNGPVDNATGPAHRYTTDPALYAQMQALGWLPEGAHFCVPPLGPR